MQRTFGPLTLAGALALAGFVRPVNSDLDEARAAGEQSPVKSERGGLLVKTSRYWFEVFFYKTGLRIFPHGGAGAPVAVSKLTGSAAFALPGAPNPVVYPLKGSAPILGREHESLDLATDLSWVPVGETKVNLTIDGLADPAESHVSFTVPFELVARPAVARAADDTAARPRPASPPPSAPHYTYQTGYYGYGYYPTPSPARPVFTAPVPAQYSSPEREMPLDRSWSSPGAIGDYDFYTQALHGG
ncbi:MAG TPA: hypothetical protein VKP69_03570 [Isosphaeraceae bacterium]|nr:hypothetical protein [Isosphaeraceae bacterium]